MAVSDIAWVTVAANGTFDMFVHGWSDKEAVCFSIIPFPGSGPGVLYPTGHATVSQGETLKHVDGTWGRYVHIQNNAPFNTCDVHIIAQSESL